MDFLFKCFFLGLLFLSKVTISIQGCHCFYFLRRSIFHLCSRNSITVVLSLFQVVRCFEDNDIVHVNGKVDPKSDADVINLELIFSDLDQVCYQNFCFCFLKHPIFQLQA